MTHKFKEETGLSVTDYIKFAKIERAKVLLKSTNQTVQDIAAALSLARATISAGFSGGYWPNPDGVP